MSAHYESLHQTTAYREAFDVEPPEALGEPHLWPRWQGLFIRGVAATTEAVAADTASETETGADTDMDTGADAGTGTALEKAKPVVPKQRVLTPGQWGLVPSWVKSASDAKLRSPKLVYARSETVTTSKNFRDAWLNGQRCIVPMQAFFEDDWRTGKAVPTRIARVDRQPMGMAGLWALWTGPEGDTLLSYTVLTVNANNHALMSRYQHAGNDKHMPVLLNEGAFDAWLNVRVEKAKEFMRQYPANWLAANPVEGKAGRSM